MSYEPKPGTRIRAMYDLLRAEFKEGRLKVRWSDLHRMYCRPIVGKTLGSHNEQSCWEALVKIAVKNGDGTWSIRHDLIQNPTQEELPMPEKQPEDQYRKELQALDDDEVELTNEMMTLEQEYEALVTRSKAIQARQGELADQLRMVFRNRIGMMPYYQFKILKEVVDAHYVDMQIASKR